MSKAEILAELPKLKAEELAEVQAKLDELAGEQWLDDGELADADKEALDAALAEYKKKPDAGSSWAEVEARIQAKLPPVTLRLIIREEAEADITEAALWYQGQRAGLGEEFIAEVRAAIESAATNPRKYRRLRRRPEVRRVLTRRFPYRIFFVLGPMPLSYFESFTGHAMIANGSQKRPGIEK